MVHLEIISNLLKIWVSYKVLILAKQQRRRVLISTKVHSVHFRTNFWMKNIVSQIVKMKREEKQKLKLKGQDTRVCLQLKRAIAMVLVKFNSQHL